MNLILERVRRTDLVFVAILWLGLALRLWGIGFGLPFMYHPDEGVPVSIALRFLRTGNLNPEFFHWPSLLFYLNAVVYLGYFVVGRWAGIFTSPADLPYPDVVIMAVGKTAMPEIFMLGRGLTAVVGTLCTVWAFLIARRVYPSKIAGWFAALFLAVDPVCIKHSQFIRPDTFAVFFALWTVFFAVQIVENPRWSNYILAAIGIGLAASSKYNLALVCVSVLVAHLLRFRATGFFRKEIYVAGVVSIVVFLLTTPFAVLDSSRFLQIGPLDDARIYSTGHPGAEGDTLQFYAAFLWSRYSLVLLLALALGLVSIIRRETKGIVLLSFALVYAVFINLYTVHFETTILPVIPWLIILAAVCLTRLFDFTARRLALNRLASGAVLAGLALGLAAEPLRASVAHNLHLLEPDGREYARQWIDAHLPPGARVMVEAYAPYPDRARFAVQGLYGLQDRPPEWYIANGFEYLVFSQGTYGRYFADPVRYAKEVERYQTLFARFPEVARFDQNGFQVRVHQTGVALPARRVAARYGDYGELVELIGYDNVQWKPDGPLRVTVYWRTLSAQSEPLEVILRLLTRDDRAIAFLRGDLFQRTGWREGMFATEWTIPVPPDTAPGAYRLQVNVEQTRFAYRPPASTWSGARIERVLLEPIKLPVTPPSTTELQSAHAANVRFGDAIALTGYTIGRAGVGEALPVTLYWQALSKPRGDYTVFVHLIDANGNLRAQVDTQPRSGTYPTLLWDAGEIVRDDYTLTLPSDLASGEYRIAIGLYEYPSLVRLQAAEDNAQGDHWVFPNRVQVIR